MIGAVLSALFSVAQGVTVLPELRNVNGVGQVPDGLFGVHATPLKAGEAEEWGIRSVRTIDHFPTGKPLVPGQDPRIPGEVRHVVECYYDRFQPALSLEFPDWKARLQSLGQTLGRESKTVNRPVMVEFWNEPYLNWGVKPGVNYNPVLFDIRNTRPGAPMVPLNRDPLPTLVWDRRLFLVDPATGQADTLASSIDETRLRDGSLKEGDEVMFRNRARRVKMLPWGRDTGQANFWAGPTNEQLYREMFTTFGPSAKAENPELVVIGGYGFHLHQGDWSAYDSLHRPLMAAAPWMDGYNEHHYGGDTRRVALSYEVVDATAWALHGHGLPSYNTEAGGYLDPARPDSVGVSKFIAKSDSERRGMISYFLRDVIHLLDVCPDKARARASHMAHESGDRWGMRLLKELRGQLRVAKSEVPDIWAVASQQPGKVTVAVFNDGLERARIPVRLKTAPGEKLIRATRFFLSSPRTPFELRETPFDGDEVELDARSAQVIVFSTSGKGATTVRQETQTYAKEILLGRKGSPLGPVLISLSRRTAPEWRLRLALDGRIEQVQFRLNGRNLQPVSGTPGIFEIPLPRGIPLRAENRLVVVGGKEGLILATASLVSVNRR